MRAEVRSFRARAHRSPPPREQVETKKKNGLAFPAYGSRSFESMKRLRRAVGGISEQVLKAHMSRVFARLPEPEADMLRRWIASAKVAQKCSGAFAFGLLVRHLSGHIHPKADNAFLAMIDTMIARQTISGLSPAN